MTFESGLLELVDTPVEHLGTTIVRQLLRASDGPARQGYTALMRAADRVDVRDRISSATARYIVEPLAEHLGHSDARLRARLVTAQISGLLNALWIVEDPALLESPADEVVRLYGAAIQAVIDAP